MANETPSSETVDFALVEQLGIDIVAKALGISADAVRKWRPRGVPKGRQAAIAELARSKQPPSTEPPGGWISSMRDQLTQPGDDDEAPASAWDDDDEGADQAPATEASTPTKPADERGPAPAPEPATCHARPTIAIGISLIRKRCHIERCAATGGAGDQETGPSQS